MLCRQLTSIIFVLLTQGGSGMRIRSLSAPRHVERGHGAHLTCEYDSGGHGVYALKWYKDGREFFRHQPDSRRPIRTFKLDGIYVDVNRSTGTHLYLTHVDLNTAGTYKCEVTSGPPMFWTVSDIAQINIIDTPESPPIIDNFRRYYRVEDELKLNCSCYRSFPPVKLVWFINNTPMTQRYRTSFKRWSLREPFNLTTSVSQMTHVLSAADFDNGRLTVRCTAKIPGTDYHKSREVLAERLSSVVFKRQRKYHPSSAHVTMSSSVSLLLILLGLTS